MPTFKTPSALSERQITDRPQKDIPGPGTYTPRENEFNNKFRNSYNLTLYRGERKIVLHDKTKLGLPGPQQYTLPSDFGSTPTNHLVSASNFAIP